MSGRLIESSVYECCVRRQLGGHVERGIDDFHFYTMNRADLVYSICHILGLRENVPVAQEAAA